MGGKTITKFEERSVCEHYRGGATFRHIASVHGISQTTVSRILKTNNIELRKNHYTKALEKEVIRLYLKYETIKEILFRTGIVSEQTIYAILKRNGIEKRSEKQT